MKKPDGPGPWTPAKMGEIAAVLHHVVQIVEKEGASEDDGKMFMPDDDSATVCRSCGHYVTDTDEEHGRKLVHARDCRLKAALRLLRGEEAPDAT